MRRGGYLGGGTIVGPHTPGWFSSEEDSAPEEAEAGGNPRKKMARHQYHKAKRLRDAMLADSSKGATPVNQRPSLTATDDARISKLRISIAGTRAELRRAEARLASERDELIALLRKYDLPLDRYPETGS